MMSYIHSFKHTVYAAEMVNGHRQHVPYPIDAQAAVDSVPYAYTIASESQNMYARGWWELNTSTNVSLCSHEQQLQAMTVALKRMVPKAGLVQFKLFFSTLNVIQNNRVSSGERKDLRH